MAHWALLFFFTSPGWAAPSFVPEGGLRLSSAAIQAATGSYPSLRVYYIRNNSQVFSAITSDGSDFVQDAGVRLSSQTAPALDIAVSSITGLSILPLNAGGFRMLYSVIGSTGAFRIYSATSADGLAWANATGTAVNVDNGQTFAQFPSLTELSSGDWRLYYIQNSTFGDQAANHQVFSALSANEGLNFSTGSAVVAAQAGQAAATLLTNNKVRVLYTAPLSGDTTNTTVLSALSTNINGSVFTLESGTRYSTPPALGALSLPCVTRSTDSFRWRLYYGVTPSSDVFSAVTDAPDPQNLAPSAAFTNGGVIAFTILGEIFSAGPGALLRQAGQSDITGTSVSRSDDQTITVNFDVRGKFPGFWDLVVTNASGTSGTLRNALFLDYQAGDLTLLDNLIRPREGTRTKANVSISIAGRVTLEVFTITGEPIGTLLDSELPAGAYSVFWDGKTASGYAAASGLYVLRAKGPKLDATRKIVVIK